LQFISPGLLRCAAIGRKVIRECRMGCLALAGIERSVANLSVHAAPPAAGRIVRAVQFQFDCRLRAVRAERRNGEQKPQSNLRAKQAEIAALGDGLLGGPEIGGRGYWVLLV
jgi:hypothetical protein